MRATFISREVFADQSIIQSVIITFHAIKRVDFYYFIREWPNPLADVPRDKRTRSSAGGLVVAARTSRVLVPARRRQARHAHRARARRAHRQDAHQQEPTPSREYGMDSTGLSGEDLPLSYMRPLWIWLFLLFIQK